MSATHGRETTSTTSCNSLRDSKLSSKASSCQLPSHEEPPSSIYLIIPRTPSPIVNSKAMGCFNATSSTPRSSDRPHVKRPITGAGVPRRWLSLAPSPHPASRAHPRSPEPPGLAAFGAPRPGQRATQRRSTGHLLSQLLQLSARIEPVQKTQSAGSHGKFVIKRRPRSSSGSMPASNAEINEAVHVCHPCQSCPRRLTPCPRPSELPARWLCSLSEAARDSWTLQVSTKNQSSCRMAVWLHGIGDKRRLVGSSGPTSSWLSIR